MCGKPLGGDPVRLTQVGDALRDVGQVPLDGDSGARPILQVGKESASFGKLQMSDRSERRLHLTARLVDGDLTASRIGNGMAVILQQVSRERFGCRIGGGEQRLRHMVGGIHRQRF